MDVKLQFWVPPKCLPLYGILWLIRKQLLIVFSCEQVISFPCVLQH